MKAASTKSDDGTITLTITIPKAGIAKAQAEIVDEYVKDATLPGFRKGKAPKKIVEEKLDKEKLKEEILKKLLPVFYVEAVKEHNLQPIVHPKIHVGKVDEGEDWEFSAITAELPQVVLKDYKKAIKDITAKSKIVLPGKEQQEPKMEDIVEALLANVTVTIPSLLVDQEVDRLLAQTLDEVKTLGLTLDQYLASTKKTPEELRKDYAEKAENDIKIEFVLQKIAEEEKIAVEEKEVEEAIARAKSDQERANLQANRYLLANILRQQKTLDFLKNL
jgi:FKBP-type peptidyl-prolyl cis-trans isomerase (trigger factor)